MLGDMWLISHFQGTFFDMPFSGCGQFGFNPDSKKYVGTWVDSMSPFAMTMEGTFDESTKTMTQFGTGKDPAGNEMKSKSTVVYNQDGSRTFTMFAPAAEDQWMKIMEIRYTKAKEQHDSKAAPSK
jgi:hypothetical protein